MVSTTKSPRASLERELISWQSGESLGVQPFSRIEAEFVRQDGPQSIEIGLEATGPQSNRVRKLITYNRSKVRAGRVVGAFKCVLFEPRDIDLVSGSPGLRRRFLDILLSQLDPTYLQALSRYSRIVEQRNSLIKSLIRDGLSSRDQATREQLDFWDNELVAFGSRILLRRIRAVASIEVFAKNRIEQFTGGANLTLSYSASGDAFTTEKLGYQWSEDAMLPDIAFAMSGQLSNARQDEFRRGVTLVGPHRDDLSVAVDDIDIGTFGSRGQQRLAAVALKLAESDLILSESGELPAILLDDVFSELDATHRTLMSRAIGELGAQVVVTATAEDALLAKELALPSLAVLEQGEFSWVR